MTLTIIILFFTALAAAISWVGYSYYARPARILDQLGPNVLPGSMTLPPPSTESGIVRIFQVIGKQMPISPADATLLRRDMIAAGFRSDRAIAVLYGMKIVLGIGLTALAFIMRSHVPNAGVVRVIFVAGAAALGYMGPGFILDRLVASRQERIKFAIPDALDLMVVCVEAGLGLDQAILAVSRELEITHPDLSEELELLTLEMQAGKRRADALRNLAERTGQDDLRQLVAVLIQTDRFGTSMAESLRTHADYMRVRRRQEAEERAGKLGVKLIFPIFFFILPSMFIIVAGPGMLQIFNELLPLMRSVR